MAESPKVSFEVYPPKSPQAAERLRGEIRKLALFRPDFLSVTYGADGSGQESSLLLVDRLQEEGKLPVTAHLTCVGSTRDETDAIARGWRDAGITRIAALRGDMPGGGPWVPHPGGYENGADLVAGLRRIADFDIAVAAYPECHPDSTDEAADLDNLKRKIDAGADTAITQFCFDTDAIVRLRDRSAAAGIAAPVIPGILPITNFARVAGFSRRCGAGVPDWLEAQFEGLDDDLETRDLVAVSVAAEQCLKLTAEGFERFHFFTLNRARLSSAVCRRLGLRPDLAKAA
jgi:methylenetetrahydrofolate reductase (NADPH)